MTDAVLLEMGKSPEILWGGALQLGSYACLSTAFGLGLFAVSNLRVAMEKRKNKGT